MHVRPWFELLPPILQEVTCPPPPIGRRRAASLRQSRRVRPWHLVPRDGFVHNE